MFASDRDGLLGRLSHRLYGSGLIRNVLRGELVEQMVLDALGEGWEDGGDYGAWDVIHVESEHKIQIKQSAARQSWAVPDATASKPRFSIAAKRTYSDERRSYDLDKTRHADTYVFAWHSGVDAMTDHADPAQWTFYVAATHDLPAAGSINLSGLNKVAKPVAYEQLAATIWQITNLSPTGSPRRHGRPPVIPPG